MSAAPGFNEDFLDILRALTRARADFVVVGAHAMAVHGVPRATGDIDILVEPSPDNAGRVFEALRDFGAPLDAHGITHRDLETPGSVYQIGLPPRRIDLLTSISGVSFDQARASRILVAVDEMEVPFLGLESLRLNKEATGRDKDLLDLRLLEEAGEDRRRDGID